jgi:hypothetical protein
MRLLARGEVGHTTRPNRLSIKGLADLSAAIRAIQGC